MTDQEVFHAWAVENKWLLLYLLKPPVETARSVTHYNGCAKWLTPQGIIMVVEYNHDDDVLSIHAEQDGFV